MESACQSFRMLLSAYADGELSPKERGSVDLHLSGCADCRARLADLKAVSALVSARLHAQAEEADFSQFADGVFKRITPEGPGLLERLRIGWSEIMAYHRAAVISSMATAAVTLAIAIPVAYKYAQSQRTEVVLRDLKLDDPSIQPVVMKLDDGRTVIMLMHRPETSGEAAPLDLDKEPPQGGDL